MHVVIFFTYDYSLKIWSDTGILDRELIYYKKMLDKDNDLQITFVTYGDDDDLNLAVNLEKIQVIPVYSIVNKSKSKIINFIKSLYIPFSLKNKIKDVDVIKQYQLQGAWISIIYKYLVKKPLIVRTGYDMYSFSIKERKNILKRYLYRSLTNLSLKKCDLYTVSSQSDHKFLCKNFKFDASKLLIRPNWILEVKDYPIKNRPKNKILSIGRLEKQKNFFNLIKSFAGSSFEIDIYGEGSEKERLQNLVKESNVKVNFKGMVEYSYLQTVYKDYAFYVSASKYEGNPKTILEAQNSGCIVIVLNEQNSKDIIDTNIDGIIVNDVEEIQKEIKTLIHDSERMNKLSKNAVKRVKENNEIKLLIDLDLNDFDNLVSV